MMPELGMDMFDTHMPPVPDMRDIAPGLEMQPEPDAMMEVPQDVMELPMPAEQPEKFVAEPGTVPKQGLVFKMYRQLDIISWILYLLSRICSYVCAFACAAELDDAAQRFER